VAHELDGHGVNARLPFVLARGQSRQLAVVRARQVPLDVLDLRRDEMEVVEQPFGGGRDESSVPDVRRERPIRLAEDPRVVQEAREDIARVTPRARVDGQEAGERQRALFEPFDAQQFIAKGLLWR
jgi:hypothetical protein